MEELPCLRITKRVQDPILTLNALETIICGAFNIYKWSMKSNFNVFVLKSDNKVLDLKYEGGDYEDFRVTMEAFYLRRGIHINNSAVFGVKGGEKIFGKDPSEAEIKFTINGKMYSLDLLVKGIPMILKNKYDDALVALSQIETICPGSRQAILINLIGKDVLTQIILIEDMALKLFSK